MQLFTLLFNAHMDNVTTKKVLVGKSQESYDTQIMKQLKKFQSWAKKHSFRKIYIRI